MTKLTPEQVAEITERVKYDTYKHTSKLASPDIAALLADRASLVAKAREWRTDWENAPKDGTPVLVSDGKDIACASYSDVLRDWIVHPQMWEGDGWTGGVAEVQFSATHFMLTQLPK
jgi:hypothetical protein